MIEALSIPILTKAIDFLFGEGQKILQERRERRMAEFAATLSAKSSTEPGDERNEANIPINAVQSRSDLVDVQIKEDVWRIHAQDIQHLVELLEIHKKNYYHARKKYAMWGEALVPQIITHSLEHEEDQIAHVMQELETSISVILQKPIVIFAPVQRGSDS